VLKTLDKRCDSFVAETLEVRPVIRADFTNNLKLFLASSRINGDDNFIRIMEDAEEARRNICQQLDRKEVFRILLECDTSN
jgi:hypothetical protein